MTEAMTEKRGRGRPAGAKNKGPSKPRQKKTAPAAHGAVSTDHNRPKDNVVPLRPEMTDDQKRALFFIHRGKYEEALDRKKKADAAFKNACKIAKAEGVAVADIKLSLTDPDVFEKRAREQVEQLKRIATWMHLPVGTQLTLLDEPDREHSDDKAFEDGKVAGLSGKDRDAPYAVHLPQANKWRQGYDEGQEELRSRFKLKDEANESAREVERESEFIT